MATPLKLGDNPWQVTAIADADGELMSVIEETTPDIYFQDGQASGDGSCNRFLGPYQTSGGGDLSFGELASTMMACLEAVMDQEQAFLFALDSVDAYSIAGSSLEMRSGGEVVLLLQALPTTLANTSWSLLELNNGKKAIVSVVQDTEITATFTEDGTMAGSSGCNSYRATWSTDQDSVEIGPPMGTRQTCPGEGIMEQEARYLEVLGLVSTYRLDAGSLEMFDEDGASLLSFQRVDE